MHIVKLRVKTAKQDCLWIIAKKQKMHNTILCFFSILDKIDKIVKIVINIIYAILAILSSKEKDIFLQILKILEIIQIENLIDWKSEILTVELVINVNMKE